jgi:hypothetical protein
MAVQPGLRRAGQHVHIDARCVHVGEPPFDVVAAAGKRPVRHACGFEHGTVAVDRRHLEIELRNLLLQEFYRRVSQHVRMGVDCFHHCFSRGGGMFCT